MVMWLAEGIALWWGPTGLGFLTIGDRHRSLVRKSAT
jgi:hypothetical protein